MKISVVAFKLLSLLLGIVLLCIVLPDIAIPSQKVEIKATVACDEEWLRIYGDHWKQAALNAVEEADRELMSQFGINLSVDTNSFITWRSNNWELNLADLLDQVARTKIIKPKSDILIAFTGQKSDYVGMAYVEGKYCIVMHQNPYYDGIVTRHEVSHLLGCEDEDPPAKNIMSEWWDYPTIWGQECKVHIAQSRQRFNKEGSLSKGTPSVPQGPAVTLQEKHDLREANKFNRFTEHMMLKEEVGIDVSFEKLTIGETKDYMTNLEIVLEISNLTQEKLFVYDLIFNSLYVPEVEPMKRYLIDKDTDNFILEPKKSKLMVVRLQLPWFQRPHPQKLMESKAISFDIISSSKRINVDEFFITAKNIKTYSQLPAHLKVLTLKRKSLNIK